jgi:uncharacterized membrane protein
MTDTSQPPPHVPFIDQVREELSFNLSDREQTLSTLVGAGLVGFGLTQPFWRRWVLVLLGGALLKRGVTGHCDLYEQLHINTRHPSR